MSKPYNGPQIVGLDKLPVFDGTGFCTWFCQLQLILMANNLLEVLDNGIAPTFVDAANKTAKERKEEKEWNCMEQKVIALITLCVSPAIGSLFKTNFKITPIGTTTTTCYSISPCLSSTTVTPATGSAPTAATPTLMAAYLRAQYGTVLLGDTFLVFKKALTICIPSSGSPTPAMNQLEALMNKLISDGIEVLDFFHTMILINVLLPIYNMATFLTAVTAPSALKPTNVRATVSAMYVNLPNQTSGTCQEDLCGGNIAAKISNVKRKPATNPKWCLQTAPGAPYASGSGLGNHHARHNAGHGGQGGGRGGSKRQDKGKGRENSAHVAQDASGGNFAAHAVSGPSQVASAPHTCSLLNCILAPADHLSAEDLDLVNVELAAGCLWFGVAPGSNDDVKLWRIVCSHVVERCRQLNADHTAPGPARKPETPISAPLASCLDPHPCVIRDLSHRERKALKANKTLGKDTLGASSSITGTYCNHCNKSPVAPWATRQLPALPLPPRVAAMGARIDVSYNLDYKGVLSNNDSNASEPNNAWLERTDTINAQETRKLSRFVPSPKHKVLPIASGSSLRLKRSKHPWAVEEVPAVSDGSDSKVSLSQGNTPLGTPADWPPLASLGMSVDDQEYVISPNSSQSHANQPQLGSSPSYVLNSSTLRTCIIYTACTLAPSNFIYLCMHNLDYA
jgi:hypothetical protein